MGFKLGLCFNNGIKYIFRFIWCTVCGVVFWRTYVHYRDGPQYIYLHEILGSWLCIARGSAAVININCAIILLPMCQCLLRLLYYCARKVNINTRRYTINTKVFHIFLGYIILLAAAVHITAHVFNAINFCEKYHSKYTNVNPFSKEKTTIFNIVFATIPGITGILMVFILLILFLTSLQFVRQRVFNVFWYSHRLFILLYVVMMIHGYKGPLRKQLNIEYHRPGCIQTTDNITDSQNSTITGMVNNVTYIEPSVTSWNTTCIEAPKFGHIECQTWLWLCVPVLLYCCDILYRLVRRSTSLHISTAKSICKDIVEISLNVDNLQLTAGQYVFINCSTISLLEWHPFSVVQVPTKTNGHILKLWIKSAGDWTEQFTKKVMPQDSILFNEENLPVSYPEVKVDGPYCSSMEHISQYKVAVCIAGGVGITPFISHLIYLEENNVNTEIQYIYLHCIVRDKTLLDNITSIVQHCSYKLGHSMRIKYDIYYTGDEKFYKHTTDVESFHTGRPSFNKIFKDIRQHQRKNTIGVFVCGPTSMCDTVRRECHINTGFHTKFVFHKETF
ncbi:hypothetical protein ACF0H5_007555 [Mactra antiquata]